MKRLGTKFLALAVTMCLVGTSNLLFANSPNNDQDSIVKDFVQHVKNLELKPDLESAVQKKVDELKSDSAQDAITEALMLAYPDYASAIESTDGDDVAAITGKLKPMTNAKDKFLSADASFYLARTLMNEERFEEALPMLERLNKELVDFSTHAASSQYFVGVAQAGLLKNKEAVQAFMQFLQFNPDAPERLRVSAWRQIQQIQAIQEGKMEDIYQRMDFSRRRLDLSEPDDVTQEQQEKVISLLTKMIKEQEKKECSSCNSQCKNTKEQQQQQQQQAQNKPKQNKSQKGGTSSNPNGKFAEKSYDDSDASPWSRLRDRSRDPANNAIKEKLPARYREIVEKYYEKASGNK